MLARYSDIPQRCGASAANASRACFADSDSDSVSVSNGTGGISSASCQTGFQAKLAETAVGLLSGQLILETDFPLHVVVPKCEGWFAGTVIDRARKKAADDVQVAVVILAVV